MAARLHAREPLHIRIDRFREWEPEPDRSTGEIIAQFYHLWRDAEGGNNTNYYSAERLAEHLPPYWADWARILLDRMTIAANAHEPTLPDFPDYILVLFTRWVIPPNQMRPLAAEAEVVHVIFPDPPDDPALLADQPVQAQSPPPSPPRTPPPALLPPTATEAMDPAANPSGPAPSSFATENPPPQQPPSRRPTRINIIPPRREPFRFVYHLDHLGRPYLPFELRGESSYEEGSSSSSSSETGEPSGSGSDWYSASDSSDD